MPTSTDVRHRTDRRRPMASAPSRDAASADPARTEPSPNEVVVRVVGGEEARRAPSTRERRGFTIRGAVVTLFLGAAAVGLFLVAGALTGLFQISNPFGSTQVDRTPPALLKQLKNVTEYHAAEGTFLVRVDVENDVDVIPSFIAGEHTLFNAIGTVDATVDFSRIATDAVQVQGESVTITLPRPEYDKAVIDPARSRVIDRDRGLADRIGDLFGDDTNNERHLYLLAADKVDAAARESNLRTRAERNTTLMLEGLLGRLGYSDVRVVFAEPAPSARATEKTQSP